MRERERAGMVEVKTKSLLPVGIGRKPSLKRGPSSEPPVQVVSRAPVPVSITPASTPISATLEVRGTYAEDHSGPGEFTGMGCARVWRGLQLD